MSYFYRDDLTYADMAFDVCADSPEGLLSSSVDALTHLMVADLASLKKEVRREFSFKTKAWPLEAALEELLYELLQKVIFYKDAEGLLLRVDVIRIDATALTQPMQSQQEAEYTLHALLTGEKIAPDRHELGTDVKGVTFHHYRVTRDARHWKATVVVDT